MPQRIAIWLLLIGVVAISSCTEELKPEPYTFSKLFTGENNKTWKVTLFETTADNVVTDRFMPTCLVDDRFKFYANTEHLYETTSGSRKCSEDEAATTTSIWAFNNSNATMIMVLPILQDDPLPFIVRRAEADDLILELFFDEENTGSYRIHFEAVDEE